MRIRRQFTVEGHSPYEGIAFRHAVERDPKPRRLGRVPPDRYRSPRRAGARSPATCWRRNISARPAFPTALKPVPEEGVPELLWRQSADSNDTAGETFRQAGVRPPGRHLDLLGLEGRLFRRRGRCARLLRRALPHAGDAESRTQLAAMVQHRPALGLWHRWPEPGPLLRRPQNRPADQVGLGL